MKKSKKIILIITIILLIILAIFTGIQIYQYKTVIKIHQTIYYKKNSLNFFFEYYENTPYHIYVKDNYIMHQTFDTDGKLLSRILVDSSKNITYCVDEGNKMYSIEDSALMPPAFVNTPGILDESLKAERSNLLDKIKLSLYIKSVTYEKLNGIETIKVHCSDKNGFETSWYDASTLYPVKRISDSHPENATYKLTDCPLSEEKITFFDINEYTEIIYEEDSNEYQVTNEINNFLEAGN